MPIPSVIYVNPKNTQVVSLKFLKDLSTGSFLNAAAVTATLFDQFGNIDPIFQNITLNYINGSQGNYQGVVAGGFNPPQGLGSGYKLIIDANQGGVLGHWEIPVTVRQRTS